MDRKALFRQMSPKRRRFVVRAVYESVFPVGSTRILTDAEYEDIEMVLGLDAIEDVLDVVSEWDLKALIRLWTAFETIEFPEDDEPAIPSAIAEWEEIVRLRDAVAVRDAVLREFIAIVRVGVCSPKLSDAIERARALLCLNRFGEPIARNNASGKEVRS